MKILVFDNYDSFTYNLVQIIEKIVGYSVDVIRNNQITLAEVHQYDKIILSLCPGIPSEAGILLDLIREYAPKKIFLVYALVSKLLQKHLGEALLTFPKYIMVWLLTYRL